MSYKPQMISSSSLPAVVRWIFGELTRIANTFTSEKANLNLPVTHIDPPKPIVGDIKLADGSNWNPNNGAGVYFYNASSNWEKIGSSVDLSAYATTASLSAYATTASLSSYATTSYVQSNFISGTDFSTSIKRFVSTAGTDAVATYKASQHEFTHGLTNGAGNAVVPDLVEVELVCTQAEFNFSVGDVVVATGSHAHASESQNNERGISVIKDTTKIHVNIAEDGIGLVVRPNETPRQINIVGGAGQKLILGVFNANAHAEGNAMPTRSRFRIAGFQDSAINGDYELSLNNPSYSTSLQGGYWLWEFTPPTTWSTSAEASSGSRTVQVIGDSAKIGDNDTNASNSHWDVRVRALLLNV